MVGVLGFFHFQLTLSPNPLSFISFLPAAGALQPGLPGLMTQQTHQAGVLINGGQGLLAERPAHALLILSPHGSF
jgi:hypothetical protein